MNSCCLVGHVARTPRVKFEGEGQQGTTFTLAITEASREGRPYTLYVPCTSFGKSAEACSLLNAEDLVAIQGKLTWRSHKAKCGQEHS
jgi:single-stranded DNA-binding protein